MEENAGVETRSVPAVSLQQTLIAIWFVQDRSMNTVARAIGFPFISGMVLEALVQAGRFTFPLILLQTIQYWCHLCFIWTKGEVLP